MIANSNRIYSRRERLDSSTAIIFQKHRAREEPSKLRAEDYVERTDHAKRDVEVLVVACKASRSMNLRDKPSVTNLVSSTEALP